VSDEDLKTKDGDPTSRTPHHVPAAAGPGRVVVVTGSASGIGAAIVERLLGLDTTVVAVDREAQQARRGLHPVRADVTDAAHAQSTAGWATDKFGGVHGLVTCAAISSLRRVEEFDSGVMREMEVNFAGTAVWIKAVVPSMRTTGGRIVTIASQLAERPVTGLAYYSASKAAIVAMSKVAAVELAEDNIAVNCLCPGPTDTPLARQLPDRPPDEDPVSRVPLGRRATPQEIAEPVVFLLQSGASFITGSTIIADGGYCAV
jgi:NAD(P)-dependent dehydrogenase (short-subunit alcohol dehydrogenase family)